MNVKTIKLNPYILLMSFVFVLFGFLLEAQSADIIYKITATNARLNREITGPITSSVGDIPAAPVDSFTWDGVGSVPLDRARIRIKVDPVSNTGFIKARWVDENGEWRYRQTLFGPPPHPTGINLGPSADRTAPLFEKEGDPITTNIFLHGNTMAGSPSNQQNGGPILPTLFNLLATWGPAKVTLNGEPFDNPFDGPVPLWVGHSMTSVGARNLDGEVRTTNDEIYSLVARDRGAVDRDDLEVHLVFHDADSGPLGEGNIPPVFQFFYHLVFEDVSIRIVHKEDADLTEESDTEEEDDEKDEDED